VGHDPTKRLKTSGITGLVTRYRLFMSAAWAIGGRTTSSQRAGSRSGKLAALEMNHDIVSTPAMDSAQPLIQPDHGL
jgi:hypothetical protein